MGLRKSIIYNLELKLRVLGSQISRTLHTKKRHDTKFLISVATKGLSSWF